MDNSTSLYLMKRYSQTLANYQIGIYCEADAIALNRYMAIERGQPFWHFCEAITNTSKTEILGEILDKARELASASQLNFYGVQGGSAFLLSAADRLSLVRLGQSDDGKLDAPPVAWLKIPQLLQPTHGYQFSHKITIANDYYIDCIHVVPEVIPLDQALKAGLYHLADFENWVAATDQTIRRKYNLCFDNITPEIGWTGQLIGKYFTFNFGLMILPGGEQQIVLLDPGSLAIADRTKPFKEETDPLAFAFQTYYCEALTTTRGLPLPGKRIPPAERPKVTYLVNCSI